MTEQHLGLSSELKKIVCIDFDLTMTNRHIWNEFITWLHQNPHITDINDAYKKYADTLQEPPFVSTFNIGALEQFFFDLAELYISVAIITYSNVGLVKAILDKFDICNVEIIGTDTVYENKYGMHNLPSQYGMNMMSHGKNMHIDCYLKKNGLNKEKCVIYLADDSVNNVYKLADYGCGDWYGITLANSINHPHISVTPNDGLMVQLRNLLYDHGVKLNSNGGF